MAEFSTRDPSQPKFWDERFAAGFTPWEAQGVPPAFSRWLAADGPGAGSSVLIPGCGSAFEVAALAARGCTVLAIDYSAAALVGFFFVDEAAAAPRRGPPFAVTSAELLGLLGGGFDLVADAPVEAAESAPVFAGRERWQQWRRR